MDQIIAFFSHIKLPIILIVIVLFFYIRYAFLIIYHLIRFGVGTAPKTASIFFFIGTIAIFGLIFLTNTQIDWQSFFDYLKQIFNI